MIYWLFGFLAIFTLEEMIRGYLGAQDKKNYLIRNLSILAAIIILLFLFGPLIVFSPVKLGFDELEHEGLVVYYSSGRLDFGKDIFAMSQQAQKANEKFYRTKTQNSVLVANSSFDMLRFGSYPDAGGTGSPLGVNVLARKASWNIIAHEMSHRNLADIATLKMVFSVPRWFDEGLASYIGKMNYYKKAEELKIDLESDRYNYDMIGWRGVLGLWRWTFGVFNEKQSKQLYGQAYLMNEYLFSRFGENKVYQLVQALKGQSFDTAFLQTFGLTQEQFHQDFVNYIRNASKSDTP